MTGPTIDRSLPFVLVDDVEDPVLHAADHHHLARVRRLRPGAPVTVGDGAGRFRLAHFGPRCEPAGPVEAAPARARRLTVAFALTKGDKPEVVVQALTEVGIDRIIPFVGARTVVRWDHAKAARNVERLRAVARESTMQAHRPWLPEVSELSTFAEVASMPGATLAHPDGPVPGAASTTTTVLVGPEGGWSPEEEAAVDRRVGLGPHVLRASTAAVAAGVLLTLTQGG